MTESPRTTPRLVVTGHVDGRAAFTSDGDAPDVVRVAGATVWPVVRAEWVSVQVMELEPRDDWPSGGGWRKVDTLDLTVVLEGTLVVELEDGGARLAPGDSLVQRATRHRMRADGALVRALVAHVSGQPATVDVRAGTDGDSGVCRVVTGAGADGRSTVLHEGEPPNVFRPGGRSILTDVWQTQGDVTGAWQVEPRDGGVKLGIVELGPGDYSDDANWHTTATVDVDVILSGTVELHLPDLPPVTLRPGDIVVQRGTHHRWQPVGEVPLRMATVMVPA